MRTKAHCGSVYPPTFLQRPSYLKDLLLPSPLLLAGFLYGIAQACSLAGPLLLQRIVQGLECLAIQKKGYHIPCETQETLYFYCIGLFMVRAAPCRSARQLRTRLPFLRASRV